MDPKKAKAPKAETETDALVESPIDAALNKKGFAEFVALHKDAESMLTDEKRTAEVLSVFEKKDKIIEFARKTVSEEVTREIGGKTGIEIAREDMDGVDELLSKLAVKDSEAFLKLAARVEHFEQNNAENADLEKQIKAAGGSDMLKGIEADALGSSKDSIQAKIDFLWKVKGTSNASGIFNTMRVMMGISPSLLNMDVAADRKTAEEKYGLQKSSFFGTFEDIDKQIALAQNLADLQEARSNLMREVFPGLAIRPILQKKVGEYLAQMSASTELSDLEKAQDFFERAKLATEKGETYTDYLKGLNKNLIQEDLDKSLEVAVAAKVTEAIGNSQLGDGALDKLEKSLVKFMEKEKLGSKDQDRYKDFFIKTLEAQVKTLAANSDTKAKALLLKRIVIKISNV